jgi:hypothetical protein
MYAVTLGHYLVKIVYYTCKMFTAMTPGCLMDNPVAMHSLLKWQKAEIFPRNFATTINFYDPKLSFRG